MASGTLRQLRFSPGFRWILAGFQTLYPKQHGDRQSLHPQHQVTVQEHFTTESTSCMWIVGVVGSCLGTVCSG